jgi:hypothetical protein
LADVLDVLIGKLGQVEAMRIATLSFNRDNVATMARWVISGDVQRLSVLCSEFFREHNGDVFNELRETLADPRHAVAAARNHCKVVCVAFADGRRYALEGSANLRTNSNREQFCLVRDARLHDWHAGWIDEEVRKNVGEAID